MIEQNYNSTRLKLFQNSNNREQTINKHLKYIDNTIIMNVGNDRLKLQYKLNIQGK